MFKRSFALIGPERRQLLRDAESAIFRDNEVARTARIRPVENRDEIEFDIYT